MPDDRRRALDRHLTEYRHARRQCKEEKQALAAAKEEAAALTEAQQAVQAVATHLQNSAHTRIAAVVSRCLKAVFDDEAYEFKVEFKSARGKTEARLVFLEGGEEIDPAEGACGGQTDVAAFALRVACLVLSTPRRRRLLILDEPMKWVNGEDYQGRVASLLQSLARDFGIQMVIVSDDDWLRIGKVVDL
jgi:DNA repair exonuclease SbcCD ATPase subunit